MPNVALVPGQYPTVPLIQAHIDGWPESTHRLAVETGSEPVEDGTLIQDHAIAQSERLTLEGWISDLVEGGSPRGATPPGVARAAEAWETLRRINRELEPVEVITPWGTYPEMLITEAEARPAGAGMKFTLKLGQVIRIRTDIGEVSADAASGPADGRSAAVRLGRIASAVPIPGPPPQIIPTPPVSGPELREAVSSAQQNVSRIDQARERANSVMQRARDVNATVRMRLSDAQNSVQRVRSTAQSIRALREWTPDIIRQANALRHLSASTYRSVVPD